MTDDLAEPETFPALVGLAERDVLDVPVVGVLKSGWEHLRDFAAESLRHNAIDTSGPAVAKTLSLLRHHQVPTSRSPPC